MDLIIEILFLIVAVIGCPLEWVLGQLGMERIFDGHGDGMGAAFARSFRCGVVTLILLTAVVLTIWFY